MQPTNVPNISTARLTRSPPDMITSVPGNAPSAVPTAILKNAFMIPIIPNFNWFCKSVQCDLCAVVAALVRLGL